MIKLFKFINNFQSVNILRRQRRFSLSKSSCLTHAHSRSCIIAIYRIGTAGPSESDLISVAFTLRNAQFGAADTKIDNNIILLRLKSFWLILLSRASCEKSCCDSTESVYFAVPFDLLAVKSPLNIFYYHS